MGQTFSRTSSTSSNNTNRNGTQNTRQVDFPMVSPQQYSLMFGGQPLHNTDSRQPNDNQGNPSNSAFHVERTPPPPQVQETITIQNSANLNKNSVSMRPIENDSSQINYKPKFELSYVVDVSCPCKANLLIDASESPDGDISCKDTSTQHIETGSGQTIHHQFSLDYIPSHSSPQTSQETKNTRYPFVIQLAPIESNNNPVEEQRTYGTFNGSLENLRVSVIRQRLRVRGHLLDIHEIYGIEDSQAGLQSECNEDGLCIVCLSDRREVAVLPCRHMCLCQECAKTLRSQTNKCPICRHVIESMLLIRVSDDT